MIARAAWWQTGVIYQVYPRSFQDSNGDGIGDLRGVIERLPYLVELGVDAIWLSPIFRSPMADFGYDISDYTDIDPLFGTRADGDALIAAAHTHGLRVILDLVPNHTSDRHPWFVESRASRDNPKRDWYLWRDPAPDGGPPNNWLSVFGGSAWAYDATTGQYYYHAFLAAQPDLNWRHPQVRSAMADVMRFWLRRGVDGFRVDVIWHLIKDDQFRDNPPNPGYRPGKDPEHHALVPLYTTDRPEIHDVIDELRRVADEFSERLLIGEIYLPIERLVTYYGRDLRGLHLPFNFSLLSARWHAPTIAALIEQYEAALPAGGWPNWVLGNHDQPRVATRVGPDQARVAAMLLLTLRGTPTIYYGDEIGMEDVAVPPERACDPCARDGHGRDGARTPMQWQHAPYAGFSTVEPWLPVGDTKTHNVGAQSADPTSLYHLHRRLIGMRRVEPVFVIGDYRPALATEDVLMYWRTLEERRMLIALHLGRAPASIPLPAGCEEGRILLSSSGDRDGETVRHRLDLRAGEGLIMEPIQ